MTQLTVVGTPERRRRSENRLYSLLYVMGYVPALLTVLARRALPHRWHEERYRGGSTLEAESVFAEAKSETNAMLALVFMV